MADLAYQKFRDLVGQNHIDTRRAAERLSEFRSLASSRHSQATQILSLARAPSSYELEESYPQYSWADAKDEYILPASGRDIDLLPDDRHGGAPARQPPTVITSFEDLSLVMSEGDMRVVSRLRDIERGGESLAVDARNGTGQDYQFNYREHHDSPEPAYAAFGANYPSIVKLLKKEYGIGPDAQDDSGQTKLSRAAQIGREELVTFLLEGDDVRADSRSKSGETPLMYASKSGNQSIVEVLLQRNDVHTDSKNEHGETCLIYASQASHE
ncbi:MAG: hypothetical protein Q9218_004826 [Villophora microphyllina]